MAGTGLASIVPRGGRSPRGWPVGCRARRLVAAPAANLSRRTGTGSPERADRDPVCLCQLAGAALDPRQTAVSPCVGSQRANHARRPQLLAIHERSADGGGAWCLAATAGTDGGETVRHFSTKAGSFPVLVQDLKGLRLSPADGGPGHRTHRMGWADRSRPGHPEHPIGTVGERWHLLELLGPDLVAHKPRPIGNVARRVGSVTPPAGCAPAGCSGAARSGSPPCRRMPTGSADWSARPAPTAS